MKASRPLGIKKASSAYLKLMSAVLVTMSISVQSANAQVSSITLENALKRTLSNNPDLVVFEFKYIRISNLCVNQVPIGK